MTIWTLGFCVVGSAWLVIRGTFISSYCGRTGVRLGLFRDPHEPSCSCSGTRFRPLPRRITWDMFHIHLSPANHMCPVISVFLTFTRRSPPLSGSNFVSIWNIHLWTQYSLQLHGKHVFLPSFFINLLFSNTPFMSIFPIFQSRIACQTSLLSTDIDWHITSDRQWFITRTRLLFIHTKSLFFVFLCPNGHWH